MSPHRASRRLGLALVLLLAGSALGSARAAEPAVDLSKVTLRVGIFHEVVKASVDATDFVKGTPYKIQWARLNGAGPTMLALAGNAIDISWGLSDTAAPKAAAEDKKPWTAQDAPLKIIALARRFDGTRYPGTVIAAHKDSGIKTLADLRGKTYAYNEGGNNEATALLALHAGGLSKKDIKVRLLQSDSLTSAIVSNAVQAGIVATDQAQAQFADGTLHRVATDLDVGFPGFVSVTARTASIEDPQIRPAIADFLTRIARYLNWAAVNPQEVAKAYIKAQQLTPEQALIAALSRANTLVTVGRDDPAVKEEIALTAKLAEIGFLVRPVDFTAVIDDRFSAAIDAGNTGVATR